MDARLLELIRSFQRSTASALRTFLDRVQLKHPFEWRSAGLPRTGQLDGTPAIEYAFHGDGLRLTIGGDRVDFDFGFDGRTGGFDDWWLAEYAAEHPAEFPEFQDRARLSAAVAAGRSAGEIIRPFRSQQDNLDYLAADIRAQAS
jgi:hypothetical protein